MERIYKTVRDSAYDIIQKKTKGMEFSMRHIIDLSDLTVKEFNDLYKLTTNIIDRPEGYVDACRGKVIEDPAA